MKRVPVHQHRGKKIGITREHVQRLYQVYWWLAEAGDEYTEQAEILRDIYYFLQNMLDVEAGIEQGYLEEQPSGELKTVRMKHLCIRDIDYEQFRSVAKTKGVTYKMDGLAPDMKGDTVLISMTMKEYITIKGELKC